MSIYLIINIGCLIWCIICTALAWHYAHESERHANRAEAALDDLRERRIVTPDDILDELNRAARRGGGQR